MIRGLAKSRFARRVLFALLFCALLPSATVAVLSVREVSSQLQTQAENRLRAEAKGFGMAVLERLLFLTSELEALSAADGKADTAFASQLAHHFTQMTLVGPDGETRTLLGSGGSVPMLTPRQVRKIQGGATVVSLDEDSLPLRVNLVRRTRNGELLVAAADTAYLWGLPRAPAADSDHGFCIVGTSLRVLACSAPVFSAFQRQVGAMHGASSGHFQWAAFDRSFLAGYWTLFLEGSFETGSWTIVLNEDMDQVLGPVVEFTRTFVLATVGAFLLVSLLSLRQVRRILDPLKRLQEGTQRIAVRDFSRPVDVQSNDEFAELAASFNAMTTELADQFEQMRSMAESERDQRSKAEAATRSKSEFLANMSHEIRTPMTAILGYADLLLESEQESEVQRRSYVEVIERNGRHLLTIINDILDLSRAESGPEIKLVRCDLRQVLERVRALLESRAHEKALEFRIELRSPVPAQILSDPVRLQQILTNLVENAIKFTERGSVAIALAMRDEPGRGQWLQIDVIDTGVGIDPSDRQRILDPFEQVDASSSRRVGGAGLGLAIVRRLVGALRGELVIESRPGEGSTFSLILDPGPLGGVEWVTETEPALGRRDPGAREAARHALPARLLLAEDGPDNARLLCHILKRAGFEVEVAENGRIAVDMVEAAEDTGEGFDLILMDMQMPELDGYEATAELRARGWQRPIIAVTAHTLVGDRERCLAAGCDEFVSKPVDRDSLVGLIRSYLPKPD